MCRALCQETQLLSALHGCFKQGVGGGWLPGGGDGKGIWRGSRMLKNPPERKGRGTLKEQSQWEAWGQSGL